MRKLAVSKTNPDLIDLNGQLIGKRRQRLLAGIAFEHIAQAEKQREQTHGSEIKTQERHKDR